VEEKENTMFWAY